MTTRPGLGAGAGAALARRTTQPTLAGQSPASAPASFVAALADQKATSVRFVEVPIDERLADNPANPPERADDDIEGLSNSIRRFGVLQPVVITPVAVYRAGNPGQHLDGKTEWVLRFGHRRRAAARMAGLTSVPAIVWTGDDGGIVATLAVALAENVHRKNMTPLQEARWLATMRDLGQMKQRQLHAETGISQGQISKRLKLLDLSPTAQDAIDEGRITVIDALEHLLNLSMDDQSRVIELASQPDGGDEQALTIAALVRQLQRQEADDHATTAAAAFATVEGAEDSAPTTDEDAGGAEKPVRSEAEAVTTPEFLAPDGSPASSASAAPASAGDAEPAAAAQDGVRTSPDESDPMPGSEQDAAVGEGQLDEQTAASRARIEACRRIANSTLKQNEILDMLVDVTLSPPKARPSRSLAIAAEWLELTVTSGPEDLALEMSGRGGKQAQRLAVATALARRETDLTSTAGVWDEVSRRHVRRLAELGAHELSTYELQKLDEPLT